MVFRFNKFEHYYRNYNVAIQTQKVKNQLENERLV